jgi:hypothetical protein
MNSISPGRQDWALVLSRCWPLSKKPALAPAQPAYFAYQPKPAISGDY